LVEEFPEGCGGGGGVRSQYFESSLTEPPKILGRMPPDKPVAINITEAQFIARANDPQTEGVIFELKHLQQYRQRLLWANGANSRLGFGKALRFHGRSIPALLQPTGQRPLMIAWFIREQQQQADSNQG
jgi:hypothetical protein